jgi:hypothetical protein
MATPASKITGTSRVAVAENRSMAMAEYRNAFRCVAESDVPGRHHDRLIDQKGDGRGFARRAIFEDIGYAGAAHDVTAVLVVSRSPA